METERLVQELAYGPTLEPFRDLVKPLVEHDRERRSDLVKSLKVYFDVGSNASGAVDRLFLHRNSMLYRLIARGEVCRFKLEGSPRKVGPAARAVERRYRRKEYRRCNLAHVTGSRERSPR